MSRLAPAEEFTDPVFTRDTATWWANFTGIPGVNICTDERLTIVEAYDRYLDWTVRKVELQDPETKEPAGVYLHKRSDTGQVLGRSTGVYTVVQNSDARDLIAEALGGTEHAVASIGALKHGAVTFCSIDFPSLPQVNTAGQVIQPYLSLVGPHDGKGALRVYGTGIRPECNNTISLGWLSGVRLARLAHTTTVAERVPALQAEIRRYLDLIPRAERTVTRLINRKVSATRMRKTIDALAPVPAKRHHEGRLTNATAVRKAKERREHLQRLALYDDRVGYVGTAWGLFQAMSTWEQQERGFRRTHTSGLVSRPHSTLTDHFTGRQEQRDTTTMKVLFRALDIDDLRLTRSGLVAV